MLNPIVRPLVAACVVATAMLAGCGGKSADASLASAKSYLAKDDLPAAIIELKNTLQAKPDLAEARFLLGKALLDREDAVAAAVELRKAADLKHPPDQVLPLLARAMLGSGEGRKLVELDATTNLGAPEAVAAFKTFVAYAHVGQGDTAKADAALAAALKAKPDHAPAVLLQARGLAGRGQVEAATKLVDGVLATTPDDVEALTLKADLLALGPSGGAAAAALYRKVLAARPGHVPAHVGLLSQLMAAGDQAGTRAQLDALQKVRPNHPQGAYYEARLAALKGDLKHADELAQQLLRLAPDSPQVLQLAGAVALRRGELRQAEQHLAKVVQLAPGAGLARQMLAQVHLGRGEPARALAVLEPLLEAPTPDGTTLSLAGSAHLLAGDAKKAEEAFARAVQANPSDPRQRTALAMARVAGGDVAAGLGELEAIAASDPGTVADLALISTNINRRNFDAAFKAIDQLEKKQPGKPQPPHLRAGVLQLRGDIGGARSQYERALAADARFFPAIDALAALDLRENKPDQARARFDAVLKADPDDVRAMLALANLDERAGMPKEEVVARLAKAISIKPADPALRARLVQYHLSKRDHKPALDAAQQAVGALPNDTDLLALLAASQAAAGETNQAVTSYNKLISLRPRATAPLLGLADVQVAMKSYDDAAATVAKAVALAPDALPLLQRAVQIDTLAGRPEAAIARARAAQAKAPKSSHGFVLEGDVEFFRRNWPQAAAAYRAALQRDADPNIAQRAYLALHSGGDRGKRDGFAAEWQKAHPKDIGFVFFLGSMAIADKDYATAEARLQQVIRVLPDNASALNNLAWVLSTQKKPGALESAERANAIAPNQPAFMDTLAMVLADQGQTPRALELQKRAVAIQPDGHGLRLRLARLYVQAGDKGAARKELDVLAQLGDKFPQQAEVRELQARL